MDAAIALSGQLLAGPAATMAARLGAAARDVLAHLPADAAGSLVSGLVTASLSMTDPAMRTAALATVVDATSSVTMGRLPVATVVTEVVKAGPARRRPRAGRDAAGPDLVVAAALRRPRLPP